jgi:hypothetical protein
MLLKPKQLNSFWKMLASAWVRHCSREGIDPKNSALKDEWRLARIRASTGRNSLTAVPSAGKPYVRLMADLEEIAGTGIYWQLRLYNADKRPLVHQIEQTCRDHDIDEEYMQDVARNALKLYSLPLRLEDLSVEQLLTVRNTLFAQGEKIGMHAERRRNQDIEPF